MNSTLELQKKLEILTDEVHDIFHAVSLNIEALNLQISHKNIPKEMEDVVQSCSVSLAELKQLLQERSTLRLNYLITQQIKQEEAKVRRQRLNDYEQKILDQRRLISDKQAFYQNLLRPKRKRPANMSIEEFQDIRRKQIHDQQNRKYELLKSQVNRLGQFHQLLKTENNSLEKECINLKNMKQNQEEQRNDIAEELTNNSLFYSALNNQLTAPNLSKFNQIYDAIEIAKQQNQKLFKQYQQEKQMEQYLKWEKQKLVAQYKQAKKQLIDCRSPKEEKQNILKRPVSR